jgi:hypothetical protein
MGWRRVGILPLVFQKIDTLAFAFAVILLSGFVG